MVAISTQVSIVPFTAPELQMSNSLQTFGQDGACEKEECFSVVYVEGIGAVKEIDGFDINLSACL